MLISMLPKGTKLMWDASPSVHPYTKQLIIYPAIVGEKHQGIKYPQNQWVKIYTPNNTSWMGGNEPCLRYPTETELNSLTWPKIKSS